MFDNVAFNVVIGLVFIYLLYSLLVTIVGEMLASWFGLRQRMLRIAIERMLNDGKYEIVKNETTREVVEDSKMRDSVEKIGPGKVKTAWISMRQKMLVIAIRLLGGGAYKIAKKIKIRKKRQGRLSKFMLKETSAFNNSFAGKFYDYPSIKYLAKVQSDQKGIFVQTKPSYISAQNFAETLINMLSEKGVGKTKFEQVNFCFQFNTFNIGFETLRYLRNLLESSGDDVNMFGNKLMQWYTETMDRTTGWYKRKLKMILFWLSFLIAVMFNIDSIRIARLLANDKDARSQLVNMGVALVQDSSRYKDFIHSNGDSIRSSAIIDTGFARVTKDINAANLVLGLGWGFDNLTEADSVSFSNGDEIFNKVYSVAAELMFLQNKTDSINHKILSNQRVIDSIKAESKYQTAILNNQLLNGSKDSVVARQNLFQLQKSINDSGIVLFRDSLIMSRFKDSALVRYKYFDAVTVNKLALVQKIDIAQAKDTAQTKEDAAGLNHRVVVIKGRVKYKAVDKTIYFIQHILPVKLSFYGFLITALMLSLGAPFWFGVLNKLLSLRSAGVKPEEKNDDPAEVRILRFNEVALPEQPAIQPQPDPLDIAVQGLKNKCNNYPGVLSIERGFIKTGGQKKQAIEIQAVSQDVIDNLSKEIGTSYNSFLLNYMVHTEIEAQFKGGDTIINAALGNTTGTLGCFAGSRDNDRKYLISCWHVLERFNDSVMDENGQTIATIKDGSITDSLDIGFAELLPGADINNKSLGIKFDWRPLSGADAINESPVQFLGAASSTLKNAVIYNNALGPRVIHHRGAGPSYTLIDLFSITKFDTSGKPVAPSVEGDSGAVIVDSLGFPLGIVVGGDASYTYAVKFSNALGKEDNTDKNKKVLYKNYHLLI